MAPEVGVLTPRPAPGKVVAPLVLPLFAGRGAYRLATVLANVALLGIWGKAAFGEYAIAMGTFGVILTITSLGVEKCALKLLPRARWTKPHLVTIFVLFSGALAVGCLAWILAVGLSAEHAALSTLAGALFVALGFNQVLVGLHRALERPWRDVGNHTALVAAIGIGTGSAAFLGLRPVGYLIVMLATVTALNLALLPTLVPTLAGLRRPALVRHAVSTSVLMSASELAGTGAVSLIFFVLARSHFHDQGGPLYLVLGASSLLVNAFGFLLRVVQPHFSVALHKGAAGAAARDRASRLVRLVAFAGTPYLIGVTAASLLWSRHTSGTAQLLPFLGLYVACVPLFFGMGAVNFILENDDRASLRLTAFGSMCGLAGAAGVALGVVPWLGALGGLAALAAGDIVHSTTLLIAAPRLLGASRRTTAPRILPEFRKDTP